MLGNCPTLLISSDTVNDIFSVSRSEFVLLQYLLRTCRHTTSIAAGNHGIPVIVSGHHFGNASGMAPHAQ